jgi:hypothetical protein
VDKNLAKSVKKLKKAIAKKGKLWYTNLERIAIGWFFCKDKIRTQ